MPSAPAGLRRTLVAALVALLPLAYAADASAIVFDLALAFDGEARDDGDADGVFDQLGVGFPTADARIQNPGTSFDIEDRIILEFDLAGLSAVSAIGNASLILAELYDAGAPQLHGAAGNGSAETTDAEITGLVSLPTGQFGDGIANTAVVDVTAFIEARFQAGDPFALFAIRGGGTDGSGLHYRIVTSEGGTAPILRIDGKEVPEPAVLGLVALGLVACGRARRQNV
jgi:hypothetical protein